MNSFLGAGNSSSCTGEPIVHLGIKLKYQKLIYFNSSDKSKFFCVVKGQSGSNTISIFSLISNIETALGINSEWQRTGTLLENFQENEVF